MKRRDFVYSLFGAAAHSAAAAAASPQTGGELRFCLRSEPKTLDPLLAADRSSEIVRYLTSGTLLRVNRATQAIEPALARSWKVSDGGRRIQFELTAARFSDGAAFTAEDVARTFERLFEPGVAAPAAEPFRSGAGREGAPKVEITGKSQVTMLLPAPIAGVERLFDAVAIQPAAAERRQAGLGPFTIAEHRPGVSMKLARNPHYWKREGGRPLPYLDSIRIDIQANREIELLRFRRGQVHLVTAIDPEAFDRLSEAVPGSAHDAGPSLESEVCWFNQAPQAPLPAHKKAWFRSTAFRRAVSSAIHRADLVRVAYRGHATAAAGPVSPANRKWYNQALRPEPHDPRQARARLEGAGFRMKEGRLHDSEGNPVEFSLITNAGNKTRERMAAMIEQDLAPLGMKVNIVTLDFPSLLERMTKQLSYECCLLGLVNVDPDPNSQMNVWLSSGASHQWSPGQKTPETPWEAEIDRLMRKQAATLDDARRKASFDRVQQIVFEQAPFLYLLHPNSLCAVAPSLRNVSQSVLLPQALWNAERFAWS